MSDDRTDDSGLDAFFDAAKRHRATPDDALTSRLFADALAAQPAPPRPSRTRPNWLAALGGWPALTGLATAAVAGIAIGLAQPAAIGDLAFGGLGDGYDFSGFGTVYVLGEADG